MSRELDDYVAQRIAEAVQIEQARAARWKRAAKELKEYADADFMHNQLLQIVCRLFDDWEPIWQEWLAWWAQNRTDWLSAHRAFGVWLRGRLAAAELTRVSQELGLYDEAVELTHGTPDTPERLARIQQADTVFKRQIRENHER